VADLDALTRELVPEPALRAWIGERLPGSGPFEVVRVTTGQSNEIFALERAGQRWLLRRPPRGSNVAGAHDVSREHRITAALDGTPVPHASPLLLCEDDAVIGVPFLVMEWVEGVRLYDALPVELDTPDGRRRVGEELFDALAALHLVPWQEVGLEGLGNPDTFTQRQVSRWMALYDRVRTRELPALVAAAALLQAEVPTMQRAALIHGDFGLHNVLYAPDVPVELVAVLDWETATIGDPLLDLGYLLGLWLEGDEPDRWFSTALPYDIEGFPGRQELATRYAARTGLDLSDIGWYRAVAQLKVACILEGAYARHVEGGSDNPGLARLEQVVPNHAEYALAIARGEA